ncbi:MAG: folate-binding protein YgfZ [Chloroflexi bacterium]|nr:folate-binding protein YgfZ [Chloroflexota bacterium]
MKTQIDLIVYEAAKETAVLVDRSSLGILKISGQTRLDLIHRMSTQALDGLQSGEGAATVLTTDIGRIIDRLILYAGGDMVYALTSENNADNIARYLMRFVFFNDDFYVRDVSGETAVFAIYGPQSQEKLELAGFPEVDFPLHHWRQAKIDGATAYLHRADPLAGDGYFVMCREAEREALWTHLVDTGLIVADEFAFDYLRIEAKLPRYGRELTGDYIPLEADLWDDVSFNKGCYTGQEIIARMESRGKLAKKLVKLQLAAPVEVGTQLTANGKKVGSVTSVAVGPNGAIGLGYVKTAVLDSGTQLMAGETAVTIP